MKKDNFDERQPSIECTLKRKMTFEERHHLMEDNLHRKKSLKEANHLVDAFFLFNLNITTKPDEY